MRAPQCLAGVKVTFHSPWMKLSHQSSSSTREKPRPRASFPTPQGTTTTPGEGIRRRVLRLKWSKWAWVISTRSMPGRSSILIPARRTRFCQKSQLAKLGSISALRSWNWTRKEEWPIQVTDTWLPSSRGKSGRRQRPCRRVSSDLSTIWQKKLPGLRERVGVSSLKERGMRLRRRPPALSASSSSGMPEPA